MAEVTCTWCGKSFNRRRGGRVQSFCSARHRVEFHSAARLWAERAMAQGILSVADLRNCHNETYTLLPDHRTSAPLPDMRAVDPAVLDALRKRGRVELRVPIGAEGITRLICLGWLDQNECRQPGIL